MLGLRQRLERPCAQAGGLVLADRISIGSKDHLPGQSLKLRLLKVGRYPAVLGADLARLEAHLGG